MHGQPATPPSPPANSRLRLRGHLEPPPEHHRGHARKERRTSTSRFPLGPYHPALPQPLELIFELRGETIAEVAPPATGYTRRGIEELVHGKSLDEALAIVERTCATAAHSHRTVACQAIEAATGQVPSARAQLVRALFAELERCLARLWMLGLTARAAGNSATWRDALDQRELLYLAVSELTGERTCWAIALPGGVRELAADAELDSLVGIMDRLEPLLDTWRAAVGPRGALGRAGLGVGRVTPEQVQLLHLAGLAARASGSAEDLRRDAPYGAYAATPIEWPDAAVQDRRGGDVAARMSLAVDDLALSISLIRQFVAALAGDETSASEPAADDAEHERDGSNTPVGSLREGQSSIEGPHGPVTVSIALTSAGTVDHLTLQPPGAELIAALPDLLRGRTVSQAPMVLASLDPCIQCVDR